MSFTSENDKAYQQAVEFLYGRLNFERQEAMTHPKDEFKLDQMLELLHRLGDPHSQLRIVHVAGTKGKGSTSVFVASMLTQAGYRTGCYTSPHLMHIEERFAIDGQPCSQVEFAQLVELLRPVVEQMDAEAIGSDRIGPTFFEVTTAMAFLHFVRRKTDFVVLEVGLGGRLDSTNVCDPILCLITTISFDHMRQLGNTLALIAREKAGIIKSQVPVITGVTQGEPWSVIRDIAAERKAPIKQIGRDFDFDYYPPCWTDTGSSARLDYFHVRDGQRTLVARDIGISAWGQHQAANAALAWAACEQLQQQGVRIEEAAMRRGLELARCAGRIEILPGNPVVLIDTAHNGASIDALSAVLRESFPLRPKGLLLAATQGKDIDGMLHSLVKDFDVIYCTRYLENPRSMDEDELTRHARRIATAEGSLVEIYTVDSPRSAWDAIVQKIPADGLICATGSFFFAAELKALLNP